MDRNKLLERIETNPKVMVGKPVIRGTRLTVQHILGLLARDITIDEITQKYEGLTRADVLACILFATEALENTDFAPLTVEVV